MVIDTSALVAILQGEPEQNLFNNKIATAESCYMSTASFVELSMIIESRYGVDGIHDLDLYLSKAGIKLIPVEEEQALLARKGFRLYGKGRHPAALNYGDCFAYALAIWLGEPLLFKGNDFSQTNVEPAVT